MPGHHTYTKFSLARGRCPLTTQSCITLTEKGLKLYIYGFPKYIFSYERKDCPLGATRNQIIHLCKFKLKRICNYTYLACKMQNFPRASPRLCPFPVPERSKEGSGKVSWDATICLLNRGRMVQSNVVGAGGAWNERTLTLLGLAREGDSVGFHWTHGTAVG